MAQAVAMALEANLGLKSERLNLDIASESIALANSAFLPQLSGTLNRQRSKYQPSDFTQGSSDISTTGINGSATFGQNLKWYGEHLRRFLVRQPVQPGRRPVELQSARWLHAAI